VRSGHASAVGDGVRLRRCIAAQVWGSYTFNSEESSANRTFVNIKEREGFIIEPFTASIANSAVAIR